MHTTSIQSHTLPAVRSYSIVISLTSAMLLGVVILFATGFSETSVAHNAAHNMRHANAFPCH